MADCPISEFSNFHSHSHFSVFDGLSLPEELLRASKDKGLKSIALTDHGVLHGTADWFLHSKKLGVKAVFGVEAYVIHSLQEWRELKQRIDLERKGKVSAEQEYAADGDTVDPKALRRKGHLVLLACNRRGLSNLYQLVFKSHKIGFYGKPRMDKEMLREHAEGLVATTACMGGVIAKRLWDLKEGTCSWDDVVQEVREYDAIFGRGRFFLELQFNELDEQQNYINECLVRLHETTGVPLTVTTDSHYSRQEEWEPRELLHMMGWSKKTVQDLPNQKLDSEIKQLYVKSPEEMWLTYERYASARIPVRTAIEAFQGTLLIDSLIEDFEPDTRQRLPTLPYENPFREMGERAIAGLRRLKLAERDEYKERLLFELDVIKKKGIANYFLVVERMINEARKHMLIGPGRGSAPGSLVCYSLGITDLDPIDHGLLFERFLDVDRAELPDIDTDFENPAAAKELLKGMFGEDNVASLSSYGTFQIKGLLKDLGRVYGLDHNLVNNVNRAIDRELKVLYKDQDKSTLVIKLEDLTRVSPTYNAFVKANPELGGQISKLYGRIRHVSRHAAGVIIGDNLPAETSCFVVHDAKTKETIVQTSFTEGIVNKNLSAMGFVKMDILGLANLRVISHAIGLISQRTGRAEAEIRESLRACNLDLDDMRVMKHIFWDGNCEGIFQFSEPGIRALAKRVRPDSFVDISAIVSLYRPGPLKGKYDDMYVHAKHSSTVSYDHPLLEGILGTTKGCLVFQEQLMKICSVLGKMPGKDVNRVRKVLLKKDKTKSDEFIKKENDELYAKFEAGCRENGFPANKTISLWNDIKSHGGYSFNKSHSDAYSVVTMQTAHLATYYPKEFYASVLSKGQASAKQSTVAGVKKLGIQVLPVDINRSKADNMIEGEGIRLSFGSVLGVGPKAIEKIVANQPYTDIVDFLDRSGATKTAIEPLIMVGAFASIGQPNIRKLERIYALYADDKNKLKQKKQRDRWLQVVAESDSSDLADYGLHEKVFFENELLGYSLVGSPFEILERRRKIEFMFEGVVQTHADFIESEESTGVLPVVVKEIKEKPQRNGQMFAFMKFATEEGVEFDSVCFATLWKHIKPRARRGSVYVVTFNRREEDPESLIVGRPGFAHTQHSAADSFIDVDQVTM